jgi:class 3 adenylate cyclase
VVAESIELATILLTDLVGSTRLANSVGPVRADELREEHFELLRDAIVSSGGREVKNTGDGLMVAFSSASAAVECAVSMQQRFERRYRRAAQGLHVRIGLGGGESTVKDGDYFGMPSIEAARLCAQAPTDGILVSSWVHHLAQRCEGIEFTSAGELELKGFPDPVEAFAVSWAPLAEESGGASRWPLPALLRSVPPVAYVGRVEERAALEKSMTLARVGQRHVVLLSGEPGIGKSRLASYAAHHCHAEGFVVCWGGCSEELAVPYEPWIDVCAQIVESAPAELLERHVKHHGGELRRLARSLGERVAGLPQPQVSDLETERHLLFGAVTGLLGKVAGTVPVCVVLDDLHWADAQSLALLKHVLRAGEQGSLQVIVTYRDSDLGKDHPLTGVLADLHRLPGVQRIALHGLGSDEVAEIMTAMAGHELDQEGVSLAAEIAQETDGNPFFVGEMFRGLSESGALVFDEDAGRWSVDRSAGIALPQSVREVIEHRVQRLGSECHQALTVAAVIGRSFELELLAAVADADESRLLDHLEAGVAASVLAESSGGVGRFRFVHALIRQTLYEGLGATRRARMHRHVAQALEDLYGADPVDHLRELALHWRLAASAADRAKAAGYALKAGQQTLERLAPADALKLFTDAVDLSSDVETQERCEALIGLGMAQFQTGDPANRETLLEASHIASALQDGNRAAAAALANHRSATGSRAFGEVDEERIAAIERAIELDDPPDPARRARLLALQAQELSWDADFAHRRALVDESMALARGAGDKRSLAAVVDSAYLAIWSAETLELRTALAEEHARLASELGDPAVEEIAQAHLYSACVERGEFERADAALQRWRAHAEEGGQPTERWFSTFQHAGLELLRGHLDIGESLAEQALQIGQDAQPTDALQTYGSQLVFIRAYQGRGVELIEMQRQAVSVHPGLPSWQAGLAASLCALDRLDEANSILAQAASDGFKHVTPSVTMLGTLALYADVAVQTRQAGSAKVLYERMAPFSQQVAWITTQGYGHVRLWLGLLADVLSEHGLADEHLMFACQFHQANDLPLWDARGHLGWAQALAARGETSLARKHAARALELSRGHGYALFEPRALAFVAAESATGT